MQLSRGRFSRPTLDHRETEILQPFLIQPGSHSPNPFRVYWLSEQRVTSAPSGILRKDSMAAVSSAMLLVPCFWIKPQCSVRSPSGDSITAPQAQGPGLVGLQDPSHQLGYWHPACVTTLPFTPVLIYHLPSDPQKIPAPRFARWYHIFPRQQVFPRRGH